MASQDRNGFPRPHFPPLETPRPDWLPYKTVPHSPEKRYILGYQDPNPLDRIGIILSQNPRSVSILEQKTVLLH
jgi:hypothetical protein